MTITATELAKIKHDEGIKAAENAVKGLTRAELSLLAGEFSVLESICEDADAVEPIDDDE